MGKTIKQLQQERQRPTGVGHVETKRPTPPKVKARETSIAALREENLQANIANVGLVGQGDSQISRLSKKYQ